ncbi:TIGR01777 family protein [Diaphorobacter aerolatus]|uniref:TIGR01777 family protein n=2 Tax=Diaphorobacter aerolatus TaxID=1288495 RepID=A0A7H0GK96_9BURK|nr:TIGR01777 family protein [Diaphorobacter aerolatus]
MTTIAFCVLAFQTMLGGFDNLWHHELHARLPQRSSARYELRLHSLREAIYGVLYLAFAWIQLQGIWAIAVAALLLAEMLITVADFLEEDRSRKLPPFERALHTVLTVSYGLLLGLLAPMLWQAAHMPTEIVFTYHGLWSWFCTAAALGVSIWSVRNAVAVWQMGKAVQPHSVRSIPQAIGTSTVLVTGATGFVGTALVRQLQHEGRRVIVLSRDPLQARAQFGNGLWAVDRLTDIPSETRIDAVVHLAGASILGGRWTRQRRQKLLASRIHITRDLLALMARMHRAPEVLISASAIGYYGTRHGAARIDESAAADPGRFQSDLCVAIEGEALRAEALGTRVVCVRPGIVLGDSGGALAPQALAARWGLASFLGTGNQPMPWIHLDDLIGLIRHAMTEPLMHGALNAVAPAMTTQADFARALAAAYGKSVWLRVPAWALRGALGELSELLLCGQNAAPLHALASGYAFAYPTLERALSQLTRTRSASTPVPSVPVEV